MFGDCWAVLDIAATNDEREIRRAYARQLKRFRPDEDPVGFQHLVEARNRALLLASFSDDSQGATAEAAPLNSDHAFETSVGLSEVFEDESTFADTSPALINEAEESKLLREVYEALDTLIGEINGSSGYPLKAWKVENWSHLFNQAALLGLDAHRVFQQMIARRLAEFLPDPDKYHSDDLANFEVGLGPCAVIEQIEEECQFTWFGVHFAQIAGQKAGDRYFSWLARVQVARALIDRRQSPQTSYSNASNGLPQFLPEDRFVLFRDEKTRKFFEQAEERGRWPFKLDIGSLFTPGSRLVEAGFTIAGLAVATLICVLGITLFVLRVDRYLTALLCLGVSIACRLYFSSTQYRRTTQHYSSYVSEADKRGMLFPAERRNYLAERRRRPGLVGHLWVVEIATTIMIIFPMINFATSWHYRDLMDYPAEVVLADQVVSLFEIAARNDAVETPIFVSLLRRMNNTASLPRNSQMADGARVRDIRDPLAIVGFRSELRELSNQTTKSVKPLSLLIARQRKLEKLAELYRISSPVERRKIEKTISQWGELLESASLFDPMFEASLWELLPPRTSEALSLVSPEQELRQLLVKQFLNDNIASIANFEKQNIAENAAQLELLLNASDSLLLSMVDASAVTKDPQAFEGETPLLDDLSREKLGNKYSGSANRILDDMIYNVIGSTDSANYSPRLAVFNEVLPVWSEEVVGWGRFVKTAALCQTAVELDDQKAVRTVMLQALETAQSANRQNRSQYWATAARQILDIPSCRARYTVSTVTLSNLQALQAQILGLIAAKNTGEAKQAALYAVAIVDEGYLGDELSAFANSYLAHDSLQKGLPKQALYYLDLAANQFNLCVQMNALRGATLQALGENERALQEFRTAQHTYACSSSDRAFSYDDAQIESKIEKLETK